VESVIGIHLQSPRLITNGKSESNATLIPICQKVTHRP